MYSTFITDVFFDLDHTLWDFEKNSALTFEKIFFENNVRVDLDNFLKAYVPINLAFWKLYREEKIKKPELRYQRLKTAFDSIDQQLPDDIIHRLSDQYIAFLSSFNYLLPNTIANGFQEIQEKKLKNAAIHTYFDQIVDSEMAGVKKPNPGIFKLALQKANVAPQKGIMVGDSIEADILGAQAVGLHALHFNAHNDTKHEYCDMIHDLSEIKRYL